MKVEQYTTALADALEAMEQRFCDDDETGGYRKDGPNKGCPLQRLDSAAEDVRILEQREISGMVNHFLRLLEDNVARRPRQG